MANQPNRNNRTPKTDTKSPAISASSIYAEAEARDRKVRNMLAVGAFVIVGAIVAMTVIGMQGKPRSAHATANPSAPRPVAAYAPKATYAYGIPYGTNPSAPVLELWEDFQCPACKALEDANGKGIRKLAEEGKVLLVYRVVNFLDLNLRNDSSTRAGNAFGCASDAGVAADYHDLIYRNQPKVEGGGYTDTQLDDFASQTGLKGDKFDAWKACVTKRTYFDWVANGLEQFGSQKLTGTPTVRLDGKVIASADAADPAKLEAIVAAVK